MSQIPDDGPDRQADLAYEAGDVFTAALTRYFAERHARVDRFVARHFTVGGSLALHREALGWDLLRVPVNLLLTVPAAALKVSAVVSRRLGAASLAYWLDTRDLFLNTAVARRIEHLIRTELLGLSVNQAQEGKPSDDALFAAMLDDPRVSHRLLRSLPAGGVSDAGLSAILATYRGTRTAAGEVSSAFVSLGVGALAFGVMTPGMMTLGPSVAAVLAHQTAVAGFPLGATLGGLWYAIVPVTVPANLLIVTIIALVLLSASLAAFAGVVAGPVQRSLGVHQRRLHRMLDVLEANLRGPARESLVVKDHYVARLLDLFDYAAAASRFFRSG